MSKREINTLLKRVRRLERVKALKKYGEDFLACEVVVEIAYPLFKKYGYNVKRVVGTVHGQSHAWLETKDLIIDPTSDQFPLPNICVKKSSKCKMYRRIH